MQSTSSSLRSFAYSSSFHPNATNLSFPSNETTLSSNTHESSLDPSSLSLIRRRRKDRACDACRRRKTKCDGPYMPDNRCTSCIQTHKACTYVELSKPRGPPKAYVTNLEDKMEKLEALLQQIQPGVDFSDELGPPVIRDSWKSAGDSPASNVSEESRHPDLLKKRSLPSLSRDSLASAVDNRSSSRSRSHLSLPSLAISQRTSKTRLPRSRRSEPRLSALYLSNEISDDGSSGEGSLPNSDDENSTVDGAYGGVVKLTNVTSESHEQNDPNGNRFHGRSSTMGLVEVTRQLKNMHLKEAVGPSSTIIRSDTSPLSSRRPEFWKTPSWEQLYEGNHIDSPTIIPSILEHFPPRDLAETLINLFFVHVNTQYPLFHRPTFDRHWREKLHHHDIWFADVCLSLFSVASRWCDDPRVLPEGTKTEYGDLDWTQAGWRYYEPAIGVHRLRRSLLYPVTLFEIQTFTLFVLFLHGTQNYPAAWIFVTVGIRKAQDLGAHRRKVYHERPNVEDELWKRAFWHLIVLDRIGSVSLGRACSIQEEDFDLDLPLEVDDEYWELPIPDRSFKQPPGLPSKISAFNQVIKLTQIMAFTMKTVYCIDRSKVFGSLFVGDWREKIVSRLTHALQQWAKDVPEHLCWSEKMKNPVFANQAAAIFAAYYSTEMLIYRPFIPSLGVSSYSIPRHLYTSLDVCVEAARASARIAKVQMERDINSVSHLISISHISAGLLLLKIWDMKIQGKALNMNSSKDTRRQLEHQINHLTSDVNILVNLLEWARPRWPVVESYLRKIQELLPQADGSNANFQESYPTVQNPESGPLSRCSIPFPIKASPAFDGKACDNWGDYSGSASLRGVDAHSTTVSCSNPSILLESHSSQLYAYTDERISTLRESHIRSSGINSTSATQEEFAWPNANDVQTAYENVPPNSRSRTLSDATRAHPFVSLARRTSAPSLPVRRHGMTENNGPKDESIVDLMAARAEDVGIHPHNPGYYHTISHNYQLQYPPGINSTRSLNGVSGDLEQSRSHSGWVQPSHEGHPTYTREGNTLYSKIY